MRRYHLFEPPLNTWSVADWNVFITELRISFPLKPAQPFSQCQLLQPEKVLGEPAQLNRKESAGLEASCWLAVREGGAMAGHPPFVVSKAYLEGGNSGRRQI